MASFNSPTRRLAPPDASLKEEESLLFHISVFKGIVPLRIPFVKRNAKKFFRAFFGRGGSESLLGGIVKEISFKVEA